MFETIKSNLLQIQEEIAPCKPRIIAVTKYFNEDAMVAAYKAGLRDFGESRVIEASAKIANLPDDVKMNSRFHFIGHLQTNKVKQAIKVFEYIVQVNNANEEQKFGFSKDEVFQSFRQILDLDGIEVVGVMNMAPLGIPEEEIKKLFSEIVQIRDGLEQKFNCKLGEISMGMSQDYKIAAQAGSTMLRIGRKLFR